MNPLLNGLRSKSDILVVKAPVNRDNSILLTQEALRMRAHHAGASRSGFTLIELLVVISIIIILATVAITALAGVMGQQQQKNAISTMKILDSSINSYHKLYGHWPLDQAFQPPIMSEATANTLVDDELNKNILKNLKRDWGQGNFDSFPTEAIRIATSDGKEYLADPWGRPYQFKVKNVTKAGKTVIQVVYYYCMGEDAQDDFPDLQTWLATPLPAVNTWPPSDKYQNDLRTTFPGGHMNIDNIYPTPE